MSGYLDTKKSVIISAPAGSGKTEKLARRYISLLEDGSAPEKILAITFTEKAAAEMKDRIMKILITEKPVLFAEFKERVPLMRITTIHAFCRKLITRFSLELGLDPSLDVLDDFRASQLWSESVFDALRDERDHPAEFFEYLKKKGLKGWGILHNTLNAMHRRRPYSELLLMKQAASCPDEEYLLAGLYEKCLRRYRARKAGLSVMDFNDMELLAYRAITSNPGWLNILYAFDEHTDHILVDEFQDTNSIQWKIIDRLTEEWRSGLGAKRSAGKTPTVFLVGDEKQSIYLFRGANVSIFHEVRRTFTEWLGRDALYLEITENYRSLPRIINFANSLFSNLMQGSLTEPWRTKYSPFSPTREGDGKVELHVIEPEGSSRQTRMKEAALIAGRIARLMGCKEPRPGKPALGAYQYSDIAILLRNRTHLSSFECSLRQQGIPYIVVGGVGFYDEPEVSLVRELVSFLADPEDDFSLFSVLRSPLFGLSESMLLPFLAARDIPLIESIRKAGASRMKKAAAVLDHFISRIYSLPLAELIEEFLNETGGWTIFSEPQRHANIMKFLRVIENYGSEGLSLIEIKEKLIQSRNSSEPKANVNAENLNAVKIMTIHGAKGLQFPVVFLPSLDETGSSKSGPVFLDEVDGAIRFAYEEEFSRRCKNGLFLLRKQKEAEEEKRLFYVAVTRAMDFLIMSGAVKRDDRDAPKIRGKLAYIENAFPGSISGPPGCLDLLNVFKSEGPVSAASSSPIVIEHDSKKFFHEPVYIESIDLSPKRENWLTVTEDIEVRTQHGEDWDVLGRIFHRLFEEISRGTLKYGEMPARVDRLVSSELSHKMHADKYRTIILKDLEKLAETGILKDIIMPSDNSYAELPFVLQDGNKVYRGRIDRVLLRDNVACVYDYKTFPVKDSEIRELAEKYRFQLKIYSEACRRLFSSASRAYIVFTHRPEIIELN